MVYPINKMIYNLLLIEVLVKRSCWTVRAKGSK